MKKLLTLTVISVLAALSTTIYLKFVHNRPVNNSQNNQVSQEDAKVDEWDSFAKDGISISFPKTWYSQNWVEENPSQGFETIFYLTKSNQSQDPSAPDEPTKNMVMIEVRKGSTDVPIEFIAYNFKDEVGFEMQTTNSIIEQGTFNVYPAYLIYQDIGSVSPKRDLYPTHILLNGQEDEVFLITVQFFNYGSDNEYSERTISEINQVLTTVKLLK